MRFFSIVALAIGLSMDAAAVSAARGLSSSRVRTEHLVKVAVFFGGFQALMPLLGFALGTVLGPWFQAWSHWIASALLLILGAKMIWEARGAAKEAAAQEAAPAAAAATAEAADDVDVDAHLYAWRPMLGLAVATSIDAFGAGIMLPMLGAPLWFSVGTIGVTTAVLSMAGLLAGRRMGAMLGSRLDALGGVVLLLLAIQILAEGLMR